MTSIYTALNPVTGHISTFKTKLIQKHGTGVTIHYENANNLVFTCLAIWPRVLKVYMGGGPRIYDGSAWTSGTTLTGERLLEGRDASVQEHHCCIGDNSLVFFTRALNQYMIIGKLSNGNFVYIGGNQDSGSYYTGNYPCRNDTLNQELSVVGYASQFYDGTNILKYPPILYSLGVGIEKNTDGSPASFMDPIYLSSFEGLSTINAAPTHVLSGSGYYSAGERRVLVSWLVELET